MYINEEINISVIITTYQAYDHLKCCVNSLCVETLAHPFEVIIWGDGGGSESESAIKECHLKLQHQGISVNSHYNTQNIGICSALNQACLLAKGTWLYIINDDMVFFHGWFEAITPLLKTNHLISTSLIEPSMANRNSFRFYHTGNFGLTPQNFDLLLYQKTAEELLKIPIEPLAIVCYPFLIEREAYWKIGGVDEAYTGPYHDPDLFLKAKLAGIKLIGYRHIALFHFSGVSLRFNQDKERYFKNKISFNWLNRESQSRLIFIQKWGIKPKKALAYLIGKIEQPVSSPWYARQVNLYDIVFYVGLILTERLRRYWLIFYHLYILNKGQD